MSKTTTAKITCPKCKHETEATLYNSVNVTLEPQKRDEILKGDFFTVPCPECGAKCLLLYPCLYHDMKQKLMLYFIPNYNEKIIAKLNENLLQVEQNQGIGEDYRLRVVGTPNQLVEKIRIFDEGLDDRVVELAKLYVAAQLGKDRPEFALAEVYYDSNGTDHQVVLFDKEHKGLAAKWEPKMYDHAKESFALMLAVDENDAKGKGYRAIDPVWALNMMQKRNNLGKNNA